MRLVWALPLLVLLAGCAAVPANEDAAYAACQRDVIVQFEVPESVVWPTEGWVAEPEGQGYFVTATVDARNDEGEPISMNVECHMLEDQGSWKLSGFNLYLVP